jgi:hypothetical protein
VPPVLTVPCNVDIGNNKCLVAVAAVNPLCRNSANQVSNCSSSLSYKTKREILCRSGIRPGIYSTRPGMLGADKNGTSRVDTDEVPVAIVGIVPTKVSAMNGKIRVGDLLTTSSTPGYAMRCANRAKCVGAIVGKALEPMVEGKGVIKVLVMLR